MKLGKILVIRGEHGHHPERFTGIPGMNCQFTDGIPSHSDLDTFLRDIDVVFSIETFYNWGAVEMARSRNIKTVLRINYELNILQTEDAYPRPDYYISPSTWNYDLISFPRRHLLNFPVDRERLPFKRKDKIERFYHIAGHQAYEDRNGTDIVLAALPYIKAPITIFTQSPLLGFLPNEVENYWEIHQGDCCVLPRRYGGQCLPMNEALSLGNLVIMPDIKPQNEFLPQSMLIPTSSHRVIPTQGGMVDCYDVDPKVLAEKINELYTLDTAELSDWANSYAKTISWDVMAPKYLDLFTKLVYGNDT